MLLQACHESANARFVNLDAKQVHIGPRLRPMGSGVPHAKANLYTQFCVVFCKALSKRGLRRINAILLAQRIKRTLLSSRHTPSAAHINLSAIL